MKILSATLATILFKTWEWRRLFGNQSQPGLNAECIMGPSSADLIHYNQCSFALENTADRVFLSH